jgi:hypothetical protein
MREDPLIVHVPMAFRRRGGRKLIVAPDGTAITAASPRFNVDNVLVKALARGLGQLISPPAPTMPPASGRPVSTRRRMVIAAVCQPLAASPPNNVRLAASSSR